MFPDLSILLDILSQLLLTFGLKILLASLLQPLAVLDLKILLEIQLRSHRNLVYPNQPVHLGENLHYQVSNY